LAAKGDGQTKQKCSGGSASEQKRTNRVGATVQGQNVPPRLHTGSRSCRCVVGAVE
jgi:hypothetical protein